MTNRTDWENVAEEIVETWWPESAVPHVLHERIEIELHNAYVAGQEGSPEVWRSNETSAVRAAQKLYMEANPQPQAYIQPIIHVDDPDRFAFGLIDAFTKKVTGEMAIPMSMGPLAIGADPNVGDYVRWERTNREMWLEGTLLEVDPERSFVYIDVKDAGGKWPVRRRGRTRCDGPRWNSVSIRRIPQPVEPERCAHGTALVEGALLPGCCIPLIDSLTPEQCRYRWLRNRSNQENPSQCTMYDLTPAQIEVGKRYRTIHDLNAEAFEVSQLRALVKRSDAERKARAPSVLVDLEDE